MSRRLPLCLGLLAIACATEPGAVARVVDPETVAVELLAGHVFDDPVALAGRFTPEVKAVDFPVRLLADRPEDYRFVDLWRVRGIDGRALITALVQIDQAPVLIDLWLEQRQGAWKIAGWDPVPRRVPHPGALGSHARHIPPELAPATFRGVHDTPPLPRAHSTGRQATTPPRVRVRYKTLRFSGCDDRREIRRRLAAAREGLRRCYEGAFGERDTRVGRLTYELRREGARLVETTLIANELTACVTRTLPETQDGCRVVVPITFRPIR